MYQLNLYTKDKKRSWMLKDYAEAKALYYKAVTVTDKTGVSLQRPDGTVILYTGTID